MNEICFQGKDNCSDVQESYSKRVRVCYYWLAKQAMYLCYIIFMETHYIHYIVTTNILSVLTRVCCCV